MKIANKKYFVFDYYHNKEFSCFVVCILENNKLREAEPFLLLDPETTSRENRTTLALDYLEENRVKEVWSCKGNSMHDEFFGFTLHYSEGKGKEYFHYDVISPNDYRHIFLERGIELKIF